MDAFGKPHFVPVRTSEDPYRLYRRLSHNHSHSFLFESLTGPDEMAETSVMGFGPSTIVRGYEDHIRVVAPEGARTIPTEDPLGALRDMMKDTAYDTHRYAGGAVGMVNYDAIRLAERIPRSHYVPEPLFEFGLYDDGILVDPRTGDKHYFWYDTDRSHMLYADEPRTGPVPLHRAGVGDGYRTVRRHGGEGQGVHTRRGHIPSGALRGGSPLRCRGIRPFYTRGCAA